MDWKEVPITNLRMSIDFSYSANPDSNRYTLHTGNRDEKRRFNSSFPSSNPFNLSWSLSKLSYWREWHVHKIPADEFRALGTMEKFL